MGYEVSREMHVTFPKIKKIQFIEIFNKFMSNPPGGRFHWGQSGEFDPEECYFTDILEEWSYPIEEDKKDDTLFRVIDFEGCKEGDDALLWEALAPVIDSGSYIENKGEDGALWRWKFNDGDFEEKYADISWD